MSVTTPLIRSWERLGANEMNSDLSGSALRPFRVSHPVISEKPFLTSSAEWMCVTPQLKMAPSSTYMLRPRRFHVVLMNFSKGEVKRAERIGVRGEPWGVP